MDFIETLKSSDSNLLVFLLTSLIAFLTWIIKGSIEKPINDSKQTFEKTYNIRIEIMTEIKNRLSLILYFKKGDENIKESLKFKEEIQTLLLKDGKSAYLSKNVLDNLIKISIEEESNYELIKKTINLIDTELYLIISKLEDEIIFYRKFSNFNPFKKIIGVVLLALQNIITILIVGLCTYFLITTFIYNSICIKVMIAILSIGIIIFANWYLKKK